jgi:hypothetical protein
MNEVKTLLVFCEGSHDVVFVQQVLKLCLNFKKVEWKFSEYPAPFNSLFKSSVQRHAAQDLSLDMAHKFFLPDCVLERDDWVILLFNSGGSSQIDKVKQLLGLFLRLLNSFFPEGANSVVIQAKYLFLYDADNIETTSWFNKIQQDFVAIDDEPTWAFDSLTVLLDNPFGAIAGDKAAYIWGANKQSGTLEDLLLPMFETEQEQLIKASSEFVDGAFAWEIEHENSKHRIAEIGKRKKAIITCAGQRKKSGSSVNVILDQAKLIGEHTFKGNHSVRSFADFIKTFVTL